MSLSQCLCLKLKPHTDLQISPGQFKCRQYLQLKKHRVSSSVFKEVLDSLKSMTTRAARAGRDTELVAVHAAPMGGLSNSNNTVRMVNVVLYFIKMHTSGN